MKSPKLGPTACLFVLLAAPSVVFSQGKMDADDADVAIMAQKIALAHSAKIPELDNNHGLPKISGWQKKACQTGVDVHDMDPAGGCTGAARETSDDSVQERVLLKGCSYEKDPFSLKFSPCRDLGNLYLREKRFVEVLALYRTSYAKGEAFNSASGAESITRAYRALGNLEMVKSELESMCNWFDEVRYCRQAKAMGVDIDMQDARERQRDRQSREDTEAAERAAMDAQLNEHIRQLHAENMEVLNQTISKTVSSIQQSQADMAQARVNAAAAKMAQQNKGAGGYPTASSGSSSGGGSSSGSSKPASQKGSSPSSDVSDTTDSSSSDTTSDKPFNPYSSTAGGYNPISGQGSASAAAGSPADKGHWIETEVTVGYANRGVPHNVGITLGLATADGNPSQYGGYVSMTNSDKNHPFFYGFAGVINERFEAGSSALIRWPAPYLAKNRDNPAFEARMSIRYWAFE